jgi:hypothetical protein
LSSWVVYHHIAYTLRSTANQTTDTWDTDREERLIAGILAHFRDLVVLATEPIGSTASAGQAAYSNMAMDIETKGLVSITRQRWSFHGAETGQPR